MPMGDKWDSTHSPGIGRDEQNLFCTEDGLPPGTGAGIQLTCFGPGLGVRGAIVQECRYCRNGVLCPAQRLENSNPSLADAHVGGVVLEDLLVCIKDLL